MMVANDVSRRDAGFEVDTNAVTIFDTLGCEELPLAPKDEVADRVLDRVIAVRQAVGGVPPARAKLTVAGRPGKRAKRRARRAT